MPITQKSSVLPRLATALGVSALALVTPVMATSALAAHHHPARRLLETVHGHHGYKTAKPQGSEVSQPFVFRGLWASRLTGNGLG